MNRIGIPLVLTILSVGLFGCSADEAVVVATPTAIPLYTRASPRSVLVDERLGSDVEPEAAAAAETATPGRSEELTSALPTPTAPAAETGNGVVVETVEIIVPEQDIGAAVTEETDGGIEVTRPALSTRAPRAQENAGGAAMLGAEGIMVSEVEVIVPSRQTAEAESAGEDAMATDAEPTSSPMADVPVEESETGEGVEAGAMEEVQTDDAEEPPEDPTGDSEASQPATLAEMTPEQIYAGLPDEVAAFFPDQADPERGAQLVASAMPAPCIACHSLEEDVPMAGPTWHKLGNKAVARVEGQSPAYYLYKSIVNPNDYVVEGYVPNVMLQNYGDVLSDEELAHIVAYLLTLRGDE